MFVRVTPKVDASGFERIVKRTPELLDKATADTTQDVIDDIRDHWSGLSPSSPGEPPATVTGELDSSLEKHKDGGGLRVVYRITMTDYGMYLEKGTSRMSARPFVAPAIERGKRTIKDKFKVVLRGG
jgi:HK97 gp10 family phage protein